MLTGGINGSQTPSPKFSDKGPPVSSDRNGTDTRQRIVSPPTEESSSKISVAGLEKVDSALPSVGNREQARAVVAQRHSNRKSHFKVCDALRNGDRGMRRFGTGEAAGV
jgi:hypothetical protein